MILSRRGGGEAFPTDMRLFRSVNDRQRPLHAFETREIATEAQDGGTVFNRQRDPRPSIDCRPCRGPEQPPRLCAWRGRGLTIANIVQKIATPRGLTSNDQSADARFELLFVGFLNFRRSTPVTVLLELGICGHGMEAERCGVESQTPKHSAGQFMH
jgi:hypothetical protein